MEAKKKLQDFLSSIVVFAVSIFILVESYKIYLKAGKVFYLSAAFVPVLLGALLLVLSVVLFLGSIKEGGVSARTTEFQEVWQAMVKDNNSLRMLTGLIMMAIYTFVLLEILPFWLATFLFMFLLMFFLDAGSITKILIITAVMDGLIVFLFQVCFRVPLP
ncbi:MAG: tripartite tricarboxylate transporter TctB family protein [Lachnospiraceae bacterium]|nr:tripartite tricarboxylate transporter TctB family protein [Lachnospiraceae bacterium]